MHILQNLVQTLDFGSMGEAALRVAAIFLCLTVHETCHGLAAYALGDPTAKSMHRLSLNPLRHIDLLGLLMMFTVGFGWAKPVPVDPRFFKKPKQGMALTALAGPASNLLLAILMLLLCKAVVLGPASAGRYLLLDFFLEVSILSIGLGVFNLIPIPPLDGSKVLGAFLPDDTYFKLMRYERYGMLFLLVLSYLGIGDRLVGRSIYTIWSFLLDLILL